MSFEDLPIDQAIQTSSNFSFNRNCSICNYM